MLYRDLHSYIVGAVRLDGDRVREAIWSDNRMFQSEIHASEVEESGPPIHLGVFAVLLSGSCFVLNYSVIVNRISRSVL